MHTFLDIANKLAVWLQWLLLFKHFKSFEAFQRLVPHHLLWGHGAIYWWKRTAVKAMRNLVKTKARILPVKSLGAPWQKSSFATVLCAAASLFFFFFSLFHEIKTHSEEPQSTSSSPCSSLAHTCFFTAVSHNLLLEKSTAFLRSPCKNLCAILHFNTVILNHLFVCAACVPGYC